MSAIETAIRNSAESEISEAKDAIRDRRSVKFHCNWSCAGLWALINVARELDLTELANELTEKADELSVTADNWED